MMDTDIIWATVWFIVGLLVFQVKGIKSFFDVVRGLVFASLHKMTDCLPLETTYDIMARH